jgi:hypothetical protein
MIVFFALIVIGLCILVENQLSKLTPSEQRELCEAMLQAQTQQYMDRWY